MPDSNDRVLAELQALRQDFNEFARTMSERTGVLESEMYSLMGNGRPGRVGELEEKVSDLRSWRWWVLGAAAGCSTTISVIAWVFVEVVKGK